MCKCQRNNLLLGLIIFGAGYYLGRKAEYTRIIQIIATDALKNKKEDVADDKH